MSVPLEDYAIIGDTQTVALVGRNGSIDWVCFPRFDSGAAFAALLGDERHGRWLIAPAGEVKATRRAYRDHTLVLETEMDADGGTVRLIDCMPPRTTEPDIVRIVEGVRGRVRMKMELVIRFDYGSVVPWVRSVGGRLQAVAGPDALTLTTPVPTEGVDLKTVAEFEVSEGDRVPFLLSWHPSTEDSPGHPDPVHLVETTDKWWRQWSERCTHEGEWHEAVARSLITLKALTFAPTGGIVAAPTTSLPERLGGVRNWDYRLCWIRDATFTLYALMLSGYDEEACAWRDWLLRAVAGHPSQLNHLYGVAGERRMPEIELGWLPGYEGSKPVRIGNAAQEQFQLDVFGEVLDAMHTARGYGIDPDENAWEMQRALVNYLEGCWREPDEGIWEVRCERRHFTHSKVMAWVAADRAVKAVERYHLPGDAARWRALRDEIHADVCANAFDAERGAFMQSYGSEYLDASALMIPLVGFLPASDPRVRGTVEAIERDLLVDGFVLRYPHPASGGIDGLPPGEGVFLPCSFWLADNYALLGRADEARALFERLLALRNDVGLLSEEYDPVAKRLIGNFPQAYSHVAVINTAHTLSAPHPFTTGEE